jgi:hypothetical protein
MDPSDWERIELLRRASLYDWRRVLSFRTKEESGHEQPWLRFLAGDNPSYPEAMLSASYGQVCRRLEQIRHDNADLTRVNIHHWQELNPVLTEALVQLTLGAPQIIYNGGLLLCRARFFDCERRRPGLPRDVAALVETLQAERTVVRVVNLSPFDARDMIIQAGAFGEHRFKRVHYSVRRSEYPGPIGSYVAPAVQCVSRAQEVNDKHLQVHLPPATEIVLDLETERFVLDPSYALPWPAD